MAWLIHILWLIYQRLVDPYKRDFLWLLRLSCLAFRYSFSCKSRTLSLEVISFHFFCEIDLISRWTFSWILPVFINSVVFLLSKTFVNSNVPSLLLSYVVLGIISTTNISATLSNWRSINPVRASHVHAQPLLCTPSHLTPESLACATCRFFHASYRLRHLRKVDHFQIV